jgi:hypothetical protein
MLSFEHPQYLALVGRRQFWLGEQPPDHITLPFRQAFRPIDHPVESSSHVASPKDDCQDSTLFKSEKTRER